MERDQRFKEILKEMSDLYRKKNADYGNSFSDAWKKFGPYVGLVYMDAKMNRIMQLLHHPEAQQVHSEKIDDTLIDLANYAIMTTMELSRQHELKKFTSFDECIEEIDRNKHIIKDTWWETFPLVLTVEMMESFNWTCKKVLNQYKMEEVTENILFYAVEAIAIKITIEKKREKDEPEVTPIRFQPEEIRLSSDTEVRIILEEGGFLPKKATEGSAGYDLFAPKNVTIHPGRSVIPLNFRLALPKGIGATVNPRSGFTLKGFEGYSSEEYYCSPEGWKIHDGGKGPSRFNADVIWGLIDSDYRGVCGVLVISHEKEPFLLAKGTKFAQMCFQRYEDVDFHEVKELEDTDRSGGGFGHTGTK